MTHTGMSKVKTANTACTRTAGFAPLKWLFSWLWVFPFRG
jgi:hypothetical protein